MKLPGASLSLWIHAGFGTVCAATVTWASDATSSAKVERWILVTAPAFQEVLQPLIQHRKTQGWDVQVLVAEIPPGEGARNDQAAEALRIRLAAMAGERPSAVLLAGTFESPHRERDNVVPSLSGRFGRMKGFPTDHGYGLPLSNGAPRVAVGRFPGRTQEEIRGMIEKTLRMERASTTTAIADRLLLMAGNPGGGMFAEMMVEQAARQRLNRLHPVWRLDATFNSALSPYYLPEENARATWRTEMEQGALFSVFLGHSDPNGMWLGGGIHFTRSDWKRLRPHEGLGVLFSCGCYALHVDDTVESHGFAAIRSASGPAAVIAATEESYAVGGLLALDGLLTCLSEPPFPVTAGEIWLRTTHGIAQGSVDEGTFRVYDQFDGSRGRIPLELQRREHLEMWLLLGDPMLRLPMPALTVEVQTRSAAICGEPLRIYGNLPPELSGAEMRVSLERPRGSPPEGAEPLPPANESNRDQRAEVATRNRGKANRLVVSSAEFRADGLRFEHTIPVPAKLGSSNVVLRVQAALPGALGFGTRWIPVRSH